MKKKYWNHARCYYLQKEIGFRSGTPYERWVVLAKADENSARSHLDYVMFRGTHSKAVRKLKSLKLP